MSIISSDADILDNYDISNYKTQPYLSKYEKTMIIIERKNQITDGALPLINNSDIYKSIDDIIIEELRQKKIPYIIKRKINNKYEYWKLHDLEVL